MAGFKRCPGNSPYCLGKTVFDCCSNDTDLDDFVSSNNALSSSETPTKRKRPAKKKKAALSPSSRFSTTVSEEEVVKSSKGCIPANTARSTGWALRAFRDWADQRNKRFAEKCPRDLFDKPHSTDAICDTLQRFVAEARRTNGTPYPPKTLYQILCGLLRYFREVQPNPPNFLDRKDTRFKKLHGTCDSVFRDLHENGVGSEKKSAQVISNENEDKLWQSGVLNF